MVIRSLVPGGSAERHGGLLPGDQLVSVNQTQLDLLTLAQAVEVLKSAPPGTVRLGIRKPLVVCLDLLVSGPGLIIVCLRPKPSTSLFGTSRMLVQTF